MIKVWKTFLIRKHHKQELLFTLLVLAILLFSFIRFLNYIELRAGETFSDPLLNIIPPVDLTWLIFSLIYISLILGIISLIRDPANLLRALQAFIIMDIIRIVTLYLMPLNPPPGMLLLNDPFVQMFGHGDILTKDLFFSGHTSTLFLLFLTAHGKVLKGIFLSCAVIVGISVLLQHVHYSIDVFSAPFFSYGSVKLAEQIKKRYFAASH
jgi:membrane-associated phospholipid phosphatase